jgi:hypothetical protein
MTERTTEDLFGMALSRDAMLPGRTLPEPASGRDSGCLVFGLGGFGS